MAHTNSYAGGLYDQHFADWADRHATRMTDRLTGFVKRRSLRPEVSASRKIQSGLRFRAAVTQQDLLRVHLEGLAL